MHDAALCAGATVRSQAKPGRDDQSREQGFATTKSPEACSSHASRNLCEKTSERILQISDESSDEASDEESTDSEDSKDSEAEDLNNNPDDVKFETAGKVLKIAEDYLKQQKHHLAAQTYSGVAQYVVGQDHSFTLRDDDGHGVESPRYHALPNKLRYLILKCCLGLSYCVFTPERCSVHGGLAWLYEAEIVIRNLRYGSQEGECMHDWLLFAGFSLPIPTAFNFIDCLIRRAEIFKALGNSSAYQHNLMKAATYLFTLDREGESGGIVKAPSDRMDAYIARIKQHGKALLGGRHPDPHSDSRYSILASSLQIRGAWKKIPIATEDIIRGKLDYSPFIWKGYIYVARAGMPEIFNIPDPAQLRRLNLNQRDKWEFVTTFPSARGESAFNYLCVDGITMYAFTGQPHLDVLDLTTNTWSTLKTTWKPTAMDIRAGIDPVWPWPGNVCGDAIQELVDDQLFVFGGINRLSAIGCNLLMKLDLKTLEWRRLSGTPWVTLYGDPSLPGPRVSCGSWVSKDEKKLYIFSGVCYKASRPEDGPPYYWTYDDLWSWDIKAEKWREEKMQGNYPSPRSGMGYVFSKKLNKALVFGGTNRTCFNMIGDSSEERCSANFYADTFIWNPTEVQEDITSDGKTVPAHWQQVQTVGFPTYRMECYLLADPDTENIYLYGGHVQADTLPSKNHTEVERRKRRTYETPLAKAIASSPLLAGVAQTIGAEVGRKTFTQQFGDLWKLHLDIPGGDFECINMDDEMRTAPLGPWQRCFECCKAGFWKKCAGTCGGKAFFCGVDCQKKSWKAHKELHGCRKLQNSAGTK